MARRPYDPLAFVPSKADLKSRSQVLEFLDDGSMPPGGRPRPTEDEIAAIRDWIRAGAEKFPTSFDDEAVLSWIARDFEGPRQSKHLTRYVSLAHLIDAKGDLKKAEAALAEAVGKKFDEVFNPVPGTAATTLNNRTFSVSGSDINLQVLGGIGVML